MKERKRTNEGKQMKIKRNEGNIKDNKGKLREIKEK